MAEETEKFNGAAELGRKFLKTQGLVPQSTASSPSFAKLFRTNSSTPQSLTYPQDLVSRENFFVAFRAIKREYPSRKAVASNDQRLATIRLPFPGELSTGYGQSYNNIEAGTLGSAAQDVASSGSVLEGSKKAIAGMALKLGEKAVGETAANIAKLTAGASRNPHMAVLFEGTEFRSHSFNFKLTALQQNDAVAIKNIVTAFKYFSSPFMIGETYTFPDEWEIQFMSAQGPLNMLFTVGRSILKNVGVKYGTEGAAVFTRDNAPLTVDLTLEFQEVNLVSKDDIANLNR